LIGAVHNTGGYSLSFSGSQIAALKNQTRNTGQHQTLCFVIPSSTAELKCEFPLSRKDKFFCLDALVEELKRMPEFIEFMLQSIYI
jgi:hypothetical protein